MATKNDCYTYRVTWSDHDEEHMGLCSDFRSLSWLAATPDSTLRGIRKVVEEVVADMRANGETIPEPIACKNYRVLSKTELSSSTP